MFTIEIVRYREHPDDKEDVEFEISAKSYEFDDDRYLKITDSEDCLIVFPPHGYSYFRIIPMED